MSREDPQLRIRLPVELKGSIEAAAQENERSINYVIVEALEKVFAQSRENKKVIECQLIEGNDNEVMKMVTLFVNKFEKFKIINIETCHKPKGVYVYYEYTTL